MNFYTQFNRSLVTFKDIFGNKNSENSETGEEVTFKNSPVEKVDRIEKETNRTSDGSVRYLKFIKIKISFK